MNRCGLFGDLNEPPFRANTCPLMNALVKASVGQCQYSYLTRVLRLFEQRQRNYDAQLVRGGSSDCREGIW